MSSQTVGFGSSIDKETYYFVQTQIKGNLQQYDQIIPVSHHCRDPCQERFREQLEAALICYVNQAVTGHPSESGLQPPSEQSTHPAY